MTRPLNKMSRIAAKTANLPQGLRSFILTKLFGRIVPFLSTASVQFEEVSAARLVVSIKNRRKVQNHIKGVHAAAMALLAETSTGFVMGMNVPDDKLLLLKSMHVDYQKRSQGDMRAVATLSDDQIELLHSTEKGTLLVNVAISDESGEAPIQCEMVWAWLPKKRD
jgi:acyl-coenzyme A thioesterase PaaI-like protein